MNDDDIHVGRGRKNGVVGEPGRRAVVESAAKAGRRPRFRMHPLPRGIFGLLDTHIHRAVVAPVAIRAAAHQPQAIR